MVWGTVCRDSGFGVGATLVVVDAESDLRNRRGDRSRRGGESENNCCESGGELHLGDWIDGLMMFECLVEDCWQ